MHNECARDAGHRPRASSRLQGGPIPDTVTLNPAEARPRLQGRARSALIERPPAPEARGP